ncbi:hypothetical protein GGF43_003075 [Coemansia sp. RSA 2618]|nr:hypothetical protein GGF43_003075 [Coemansia sp. RSA 2618]
MSQPDSDGFVRFINEIISKQRTLKKSKFYESLTPAMDAIKEFAPEEIVCYGIGSLHSTVPQWQLALALIFNDILHVSIHSFDPVTTADDIAMLCHFGVSPIAENEEGRRKATKRTLFYMPHCEQFLYENTVSANWSYEHIGQTMIIGNHFSRYQDTQTEQQFTQSSPRIKSVLPHLTVIDMPAESSLGLRHCPYAFSDMCIQYIIPPDAANIEFSAA